jgi:hypothetical protein
MGSIANLGPVNLDQIVFLIPLGTLFNAVLVVTKKDGVVLGCLKLRPSSSRVHVITQHWCWLAMSCKSLKDETGQVAYLKDILAGLEPHHHMKQLTHVYTHSAGVSFFRAHYVLAATRINAVIAGFRQHRPFPICYKFL